MNNVSVIIPSYRNPKYLDLCLRSAVENRENPETEIVVVVDGFFEESREILEKYSEILYLDLGTNRGMQFALNAGVMQASNPFVFIVNDDNVFPTDWDRRLQEQIREVTETYGDRFVLTVDQIEPTGPGMFHFPVVDIGQDLQTFDYERFLEIELARQGDQPTAEDGHIFPFVVAKRYYMAVGGFDTFYNSPNVCDWDHMLKYELLDFRFPRTRALRLYHFGSVATKKNAESQQFRDRESQAFNEFEWKWGFLPHNQPGTNRKLPDGNYRGIGKSI
jgi:glycosyltransferase involved in cell wall biosynthesis